MQVERPAESNEVVVPGLTTFVDGMEGESRSGRMNHRQQDQVNAVFNVHETRIHSAETYKRSATAKIIDDLRTEGHRTRTINRARSNNGRRQAGVDRRPEA